ncbi:MAG TPA: hypothetical protein VMD91_07900 [Candidatus Sulfotelmatobacter sp.]|nr:hypothetical protein [Candidatus Sulfotelmatobacter sp.]
MRVPARRVAILSAAVAAALTVAPAYADLSLDIQPARYEIEAAPGTSKTVPITIRNVGTGATHVVAAMADYVLSEDGKASFPTSGTNRYSSGKWGSVNPREFDLQPGAFEQIRYTVSVPANAHGEYATLIFFTTRPPRKPGGFGLTERVAARMYVVTPDGGNPNGAVTDVSSQPQTLGRRYAVAFKNEGDMHVYINGHVDVAQGGTVVDRVTLPKDVLVERGGKRIVSADGKTLPPGTYTATAVIDYGGASRVAGRTAFVVH